MTDLIGWDYNKSVEIVRPKVRNWKNITVDLVREIYTAQQALKNFGGDRRSSDFNVPSGTLKSFTDYLIDVDMPKRTAYRYLERYIPETDKLITADERQKLIDDKKKADREHKAVEKYCIQQRIVTGEKPSMWEDSYEAEYQKRINEKETEERIQKAFDKNKKKTEDDTQQKIEEAKQERKENPTDFDRVAAEAEKLFSSWDADKHLDLSSFADNMNQREMFQAIEKYVDCFDSLTEKLEAVHNLIKKLKMIANEFQQASVESAEVESEPDLGGL